MRKLFMGVLLLILILNNTTKIVLANETPSLTTDFITLKKGEVFNINVINKIKNSKYYWYSNNNDIVTVNEENGIIEANNIGKTSVVCEIISEKTKFKLKSDIIVIDVPVFFRNKLMSHALGGYEGNIYNNTEEALIESINNEFTFIEVDMTLTSEDYLVCSHGWDKDTSEKTGVAYNEENPVMDYKTFSETLIQGKYKTIPASTIYKYMKKYPNLLFEIDMKKFDFERTVILTNKLLEAFEYDEKVLNRLLIQVYDAESFYAVNSVYNFKNYQYFVNKAELKDMDSVVNFCKENEIISVAINHKNITKKVVDRFKDNGLCVLTHTVDDISVAQELLKLKVDVICTNFLTYNDFITG